MSKSNIALIGFMATGKTTVGKALVDYLGNPYSFIETDQVIIENVGKDIPKIFAEEGEKKFREYEISDSASRRKPQCDHFYQMPHSRSPGEGRRDED